MESTPGLPSQASILSPITIVGAGGKMGAWLANLLRTCGLFVNEIDRDTPNVERLAFLQQSHCVLFSVPISLTVSIIQEDLKHVTSDALLVDVTSLKAAPLTALLQHPGEVLGLHPMCAPTDSGLLNQPVVVCPGRVGSKAREFLRILSELGAKSIEMDAEHHDKLMAVVQGLNHFTSIVFAHALKATGISVEESFKVASPVYEVRMELVGRILAQNPELYADIELENPHVPEVIDAYVASLQSFKEAIKAGSRDACVEFINEAAASFGPYRHTALAHSDNLLRIRQKQPTGLLQQLQIPHLLPGQGRDSGPK